MSSGRVRIGQTTLGAITDFVSSFGSMPHYVYFYPESGNDSIRIDLYEARPAFYCGGCEAFSIAGTKSQPVGKASTSQ
jgi:hypothetical protein